MFITLLLVTFGIALTTTLITVRLFNKPISSILVHLVSGDLSSVWLRYIKFAMYVVGISGGVRVWELEKYITPREKEIAPVLLNADRWTLEVYRTIIETLQSVAWLLLVFFLFSLLAYVITKGFELRHARGGPEKE